MNKLISSTVVSLNRYLPLNWLNTTIFKTTVSVLFIATASGCGSSSSSSADNTVDGDGSSSTTGSLVGTWDQCDGNRRNTYAFTADRWTQYLAFFNNEECSGAPISQEGLQDPNAVYFAGTYDIVGTGTSEEGLDVQLINMTSDTFGTVAAIKVNQFNIVYTGTQNELVFGGFGNRSEQSRSTQLKFDEPFIRR